MPWCPKCKAEYREGFTKCSTCDMELVDSFEETKEYDATQITEPVYEIKDYRRVKYVIALLEERSVPFKIDEGMVYVSPSHVKKVKKLLEGDEVEAEEGTDGMDLEGEDPEYKGDDLIVMGIAKWEKDLPKIAEALEQQGIPYTMEGKGIFVQSDYLEDALDATEPYKELLVSEADTDEEYAETDEVIHRTVQGIVDSIPGSKWYWGGDGHEDTEQPLKEEEKPIQAAPQSFDTPEAFKAEAQHKYKGEKEEHALGEEKKKKWGLFSRKDEQDW